MLDQHPTRAGSDAERRVPAHGRDVQPLKYLTVGWSVADGLVAIAAALATGSVALLGFGADGFVECVGSSPHLAPPG